MGIATIGVSRVMYEPFVQAIDQYQPHPLHKKTLEDFTAFLTVCDDCPYRVELRCPKCKCGRNGKSCIRLAELPDAKCPKGRS